MVETLASRYQRRLEEETNPPGWRSPGSLVFEAMLQTSTTLTEAGSAIGDGKKLNFVNSLSEDYWLYIQT